MQAQIQLRLMASTGTPSPKEEARPNELDRASRLYSLAGTIWPPAAMKFISCRAPQCELSRPRRHGVARERRAPSQNARGAPPFRDVQPRDAWPLRCGDEWNANYVPPPFCGARLLFLTFVSSIGLTEPPRKVPTTMLVPQSTEDRGFPGRRLRSAPFFRGQHPWLP